jgi:hypothetical protein
VLHLSHYDGVQGCPAFQTVSHAWLEENACEGRSCKVLGWYPGEGDTVYLDERMDIEDNLFHTSIALHEIVHWVQGVEGALTGDCQNALEAEREAYAIQREFVTAYGEYYSVGSVLPMLRCEN